MKYVVYCDESRHDGSPKNKFLAIGSLWMPRDDRDAYTIRVRSIREKYGLHSEVKWSKTSRLCLPGYQELVDFFFRSPNLHFRAIVVEQQKTDYGRFHDGDRELGFYKFYYEMLVKWIQQNNEYLILLDYKENKDAGRYVMLRRILENKLKGTAWITDLTVIDSGESPLAQVCDLLTGAITASWCDDLKGPKLDLVNHIATYRGMPLSSASPCPRIEKMNVFRIDIG